MPPHDPDPDVSSPPVPTASRIVHPTHCASATLSSGSVSRHAPCCDTPCVPLLIQTAAKCHAFSDATPPPAHRRQTDATLQQQDVLESPPAVQTAVFGMLYVVHKERLDSSNWIALAKLALDFLQLFLLLLQPQFGWTLNRNAWCAALPETALAGMKQLPSISDHLLNASAATSPW